jgi:hypothetical protein
MSPRKIAATFPLRLPHSTRLQAVEIAKREGLSLNQFIVIALVEKITRLTMPKGPDRSGSLGLASCTEPEQQDDTKCA